MEQHPLVSFIIPYFNSGSTIEETIQSIFNQSYANFDIWLINDGSTDPFSIEKLKEFEGNARIHIIHQENAGPSTARNTAIARANGSIIVPLDADDLLEVNAIQESVEFLNANPNVGVYYGNLRYFGDREELKIQEPFALQKQLLWNQLAVCAFIKKEVFDSTGGYDTELSVMGLEDWEFWIRVYANGWKFSKTDSVQFSIRVSTDSRTFMQANKNIAEIQSYVYQKHASLLGEEYKNLYYKLKMERESPDYRIGSALLSPYRWIKNRLK